MGTMNGGASVEGLVTGFRGLHYLGLSMGDITCSDKEFDSIMDTWIMQYFHVLKMQSLLSKMDPMV